MRPPPQGFEVMVVECSERITKRPDPSQWAPNELLTLQEAAQLFWPDGPITVSTLRTAVRDRQLAVVTIARKLFTCPAAVKAMAVFETALPPRGPLKSNEHEGRMSLAEAKALLARTKERA
jgi:hypothetical protein